MSLLTLSQSSNHNTESLLIFAIGIGEGGLLSVENNALVKADREGFVLQVMQSQRRMTSSHADETVMFLEL